MNTIIYVAIVLQAMFIVCALAEIAEHEPRREAT